MPKQRLLTREEFERWLLDNNIRPLVRPPFSLVPCVCGDVNCHGWRFIIDEARGQVDPARHRRGAGVCLTRVGSAPASSRRFAQP